MKATRHILHYILFFTAIQVITLSALHLFKAQELDYFFTQRQSDIEGQYRLVTHSYQQRIEMNYEKMLSTPEVLSLMEQASVADTEERGRLRQELFSRFLPLYQTLLKNSFRQVHFHLADGTSFLRMHMPKLFGDPLARIRPSVMQVNSTGKSATGFEIGRNCQAYRFIFPLARNGHQLGSVEISFPMSTLLKDLIESFPAEYRFIVSKERAAEHLDPAELHKRFPATSFSAAFLHDSEEAKAMEGHTHPESGGHINQGQIDRIDKALQEPLAKQLQAYKTFSLSLLLEDKDFLVHLLPIHDISGKAAGYLMTYESSPTLTAMKWRYTVGYLLVTTFSLLLIALHSLAATKRFKHLLLQQKLQQKLNESHAELDQIFNTAADGMWLLDLDGTIRRANNTMAELTHLPMDQLINSKCHEVFSGAICHSDTCPLYLIRNGAEHFKTETEKVRLDGSTTTCLISVTPFYNGSGELAGIVEDFRDISERKELEQRLLAQSTTDELTGLCNRRGFMNLARQQLDYVKRAGGELFLVFADLDNMKWINDNLGHETGDKALITTAILLRSAVRDADIVGRMGGDEFAILFTSVSSSDSEPILLARLERELALINQGVPADQQIAISFGIAHDPEGASLEDLLVLADTRMYAAKKRKKS